MCLENTDPAAAGTAEVVKHSIYLSFFSVAIQKMMSLSFSVHSLQLDLTFMITEQ